MERSVTQACGQGVGRGLLRWLKVLALAGASVGCESYPPALAEVEEPELTYLQSGLTQVTSFGTNPGNLRMYKYVPAGVPANAPLVVALHGCSQGAAEYVNAGWSSLADAWKFYVLYPEQQSANNSSRCFNWFEPGDTARGQGEALSIKQMVDKMKADHSIDGQRVFATGLSAGGAMTAVLAATYPDVFSGAAIMAGIPYRCATTMTAAFSCMNPGRDLTPRQWGDLVRGAYSGYTGPWPRISLWHGSSDTVVYPVNTTELMQQWTDVHGIDQAEDVSETVAGYPRKAYRDSQGNTRVETYTITGMGHGTAVDPQFSFPGSTLKCGTAGAYLLDRDICSTWYVGRFFGLSGPDASDSVPPTVSLTSPASGATVSGTVQVAISASDNVGVARVELLVDNVLVGTDSTSPYQIAWDASTATNGTHVLLARAFDAAGNSATSASVSVTVEQGAAADFTESFSSNGPDRTGWSLTEWALNADDQGGLTSSQSIRGSATPAFNTVTRTASISVRLGATPRLTYWRKLDLYGANISASAAFRVVVNDGTDRVVDQVTRTGLGTTAESTWTQRANIDLSAVANKTVTLRFVVTATDTGSNISRANAWVDSILISGAAASGAALSVEYE